MNSVEPPAQAGGQSASGADPVLQGARPRRRSDRTGRTPRAGRDLPAAITVGLILLAAVLVGLFFQPLAFVLLTTVFCVLGVWEVSHAVRVRSIQVPLVPVLVASVAIPFSAYLGGPEALAFALAASVTAVLLWRAIDSREDVVRSVMSGVFTLIWIPLLISFALLMLREPEGNFRVATTLVLVVANDTFGYLVGVLFGKHPMAPKISPKKTWEGFAGSVAGAIVIGILAAVFLLNGAWWFGLVLAMATVAAATAGDLAESMVKRELGIKDMGKMLPGHGGIMDRLDSIVFAVPVAYVISVLLAPGSI